MARAVSRRSVSRSAPDAGKYRNREDEDVREDEDEEDDRPRRRASRASRDDDRPKRPTRSRARDDDDDEDDRPRRRARARDDDDDDDDDDRGPNPVASGWGAWKSNKDSMSGFPDELKVSEEQQLIKFTKDAPYATYRQHWIEGLTSTKKKSYICLEDDCPLCEQLGDNPRAIAEFNVVLMDRTPKNMIWKVGTRVGGQLENLHEKDGPLTEHYWAVSKSGKKAQTSYSVQKVKERDVEEDWGVEPLSDEEIEDFTDSAWDSSSVRFNTRRELQAIADEAMS